MCGLLRARVRMRLDTVGRVLPAMQALEVHHKLILLALVESRLGKSAAKKAVTLEQVSASAARCLSAPAINPGMCYMF
jgi:hypothetical protein